MIYSYINELEYLKTLKTINEGISKSEIITTLKKITDTTPKQLTQLSNKQILDYHRKFHMFYNGNINRKPLNKDFINLVVDLHNKVVAELIRRKYKHNTPLEGIE